MGRDQRAIVRQAATEADPIGAGDAMHLQGAVHDRPFAFAGALPRSRHAATVEPETPHAVAEAERDGGGLVQREIERRPDRDARAHARMRRAPERVRLVQRSDDGVGKITVGGTTS